MCGLSIFISLAGYISSMFFILYSKICYTLYHLFINGPHIVKRPKNTERVKGNIAFFVCCDGKGHLTQFMTLSSLLMERNFNISAVFINNNSKCDIPQYFMDYCHTKSIPVHYFYGISLNSTFSSGKIRYLTTLKHALVEGPELMSYANYCSGILEETKTSTVINLFTIECSLYNINCDFGCKIVSVATQYKNMIDYSKKYKMLSRCRLNTIDHFIGKSGMDSVIRTTCYSSSNTICLSPIPITNPKIKSFPVLGNTKISLQDIHLNTISKESGGKRIICVYALYNSYVNYIEEISDMYPEAMFFIFSKHTTDTKKANVKLINTDVFLFASCLSQCDVLISTAGIETVCEAISMTKPAILIHVTGHYEQFQNAKLFSYLVGVEHVNCFSDTRAISNSLSMFLGHNYDRRKYIEQCEEIKQYMDNFNLDELIKLL